MTCLSPLLQNLCETINMGKEFLLPLLELLFEIEEGSSYLSQSSIKEPFTKHMGAFAETKSGVSLNNVMSLP